MDNVLNEKYKSIISFFEEASEEVCHDYNFKVIMDVLPDDILNAQVYKDNLQSDVYHIELYSRCLNLSYLIETITKKFDSNDLLFFEDVRKIDLFGKMEASTLREELNNVFATTILTHIFFHECGHIMAGHIELKSFFYSEYDSKKVGSYYDQEKEMVADWLSTKYILKSIYKIFSGEDEHHPSPEEIVRSIRKVIVLFWVSLAIEFQIFDACHIKSSTENSKRTHPHPSVRLFYNLEAVFEGVNDLLLAHGLDEDSAEKGTNLIVSDVYTIIQSFIGIMEVPLYNDLMKNETVDYYMKLRDVPFEEEWYDDYLHLAQLSPNYRKIVDQYRKHLR